MRLQRAALGVVPALIILMGTPVFAAKVTKTDGRKAMLDLEGDSASPGDIFVVSDGAGKKKGLIKIKAVKGNRAVGLVGKGKVQAGWSAKPSTAKSKSAKTKGPSLPTGGDRSYWGMMGGMGMNSMSIDIDNVGNDNIADKTVALSGTSFSAKAIYDYNVFPQIWFRGMAGLEGLNATGSTEAGCGAEACKVSIYYLAADFWARYIFSEGTIRPWLGGAFSLMFPATKDATALEDSSITNTSAMSVGGGFDWYTSPTFYVPVQIEYNMLPKSETVEASAISFRVGFAVPF